MIIIAITTPKVTDEDVYTIYGLTTEEITYIEEFVISHSI